jgi:hypothetical protein
LKKCNFIATAEDYREDLSRIYRKGLLYIVLVVSRGSPHAHIARKKMLRSFISMAF